MQLSVLDIAIIIDTLRGSLMIADGGNIWGYRKDARIDLVNRLCATASVTPAADALSATDDTEAQVTDERMTEVDWLRAEIAWLRDTLTQENVVTGLCLWQAGPDTLLSVTKDGFTEGILDGAMIISGMHRMENKIEIHATPDSDGYPVRCLKHLVESSGDSYLFVRDGDSISNITPDMPGTPWRADIGDVIVRYFSPVLCLYMPQGEWHLGILAAD